MKLGIVGATGLVGQAFLRHLRPFFQDIEELRLFSRSQPGCLFEGKRHKTRRLEEGCFKGLDICFFSAGAEVSRKWAPRGASEGAMVIDNSSAFRQEPDIPLITPEINGGLLEPKPQIIANPNCSTIQMVMALYPLHRAFGLKEVRAASLQSASGAGRQAVERLKSGTRDVLEGRRPYETSAGGQEPAETAFNCVPYIGGIGEAGFCGEEEKIISESKKIMSAPDLKISAFTVRVPCLNSHGVAVWASLEKSPSMREIREAMSPFVRLQREGEEPPHGRMASGKKEVFVGRLRKDGLSENSWIMWIVADNLLKGASLNGLQIAENLWKKKTAGGAAGKAPR